MQVTFETRARSAAHFCPFVKPFSEKFVGDFVKNESLSPVFSRDRDSERLFYRQEGIGMYLSKPLIAGVRLQHRFCLDMDIGILE